MVAVAKGSRLLLNKLFIIKDGAFKWIADVDATGKVIENKHKGRTGKDINIKNCWKVK